MTVLRLLFVEDNDDLREAIGLMLDGEGRQISAYGSAEEALAAFEREPFDVLITDVSLRCLAPNWRAACSRLRRAHGSCWHRATTCARASKRWARPRALPKPFELDELDALLGEIATAIEKRASSS